MRQADAVTAFANGPNRTRHEPAAAIGTDVLEHVAHTIRAESALVTADARRGRIGRQLAAAKFTVGAGSSCLVCRKRVERLSGSKVQGPTAAIVIGNLPFAFFQTIPVRTIFDNDTGVIPGGVLPL